MLIKKHLANILYNKNGNKVTIMVANFINDIVSQLGNGKKGGVHISITPGIGVEMAQIDPTERVIKKYGYKALEYNEALKEIKDYHKLKNALSDLYSELKIDPKSPVVLTLPTVHMGRIDLPLILNDEMIQEAITSEVEQSYIFKRCEPVISWIEVLGNQGSENRTMIYAAVQKPVIEAVRDTLSLLGAPLDKLEISLASDIRALAYTGLTATQMADGNLWTLMIIKSNGYELVQMNGQKIVDYYAEPLALKTYEFEEVYDALYASVQIALLNYPSNNITILSETDLVSAEHMAEKMQVNGNVAFIENNEYKKEEFMPVSLNVLPDMASKISLSIIGAASFYLQNTVTDFEFTGNGQNAAIITQPIYITWKGKQYEITEIMMIYAILAIGAILIIPSLLALLFFSSAEKSSQKNLDDIYGKIHAADEEINKLNEDLNNNGFNAATEIEKVIWNNRTKLIAYSAIGESVPKKLWVKYVKVRDDSKVDIVGVSENVENIYVFYRNLKDSIIDSQLRLHRLEMLSDSIDAAVTSSSNYEFEITNMSDEDLQPKPEGNNENNNGDSNNNGNKSVSDLEEVEVH